jgi:zinc protease
MSLSLRSTRRALWMAAVLTSLLCLSPSPASAKLPDAQPAHGDIPAFTMPSPERFTLSNGVEVWLLTRTELPMVSLTISVPYGSMSDPVGKDGLAQFTASMLDEGTQKRDALAFEDEVDILGASLSAYAGLDNSGVALDVLRRNLEPALDLAVEMLTEPAFKQADFDRLLPLWLASLQQRAEDPNSISSLVAARAFFGDASPLAHPASGYAKTVSTLTPADLKAFHAAHWRPDGASLLVVGAIDAATLKPLLEAKLAAVWKAPATPAPAQPEPNAQAPARRFIIVDRPGAPQTVVRVVMPGRPQSSPQEPHIQLLNTIFGGSFTSRLQQNIREDKGYSYGAGSFFGRLRGVGTFVSRSAVRADVTGPALQEFIKEYNRLAKGDIVAEEMARALSSMRTDTIQSFESQRGIADLYTSLATAKQDPLYPQQVLERAQKLSLADLNAFAQEISHLDLATVLLVGDKSMILLQMNGIDLPPYELRNSDGELLPDPKAPAPAPNP